MSDSEQLAQRLGESGLEKRTEGIWGLVVGVAIKYGLPSLCCIYLFYVIEKKDAIIYTTVKEVTQALVQNNSALQELAAAIKSQKP